MTIKANAMQGVSTRYRDVKRGSPDYLAKVVSDQNADRKDVIYGEFSWDGGETWYGFAGSLTLMRIRMACDSGMERARALLAASDYPDMMFDWSGIRDSSPETIKVLEAMAKAFIPDAEFYGRLGIEA